MAEQIITFEKVNKWFAQFHVLRDIDLTVGSGERIVICGPEAYLFIAAIYWVFCFAMSRYSQWVEQHLNVGHRRA